VFTAFATDLRHVASVAANRFAAFAANLRHVDSVPAYGLAAFASGLARFIRRKLMCGAFFVGRFTAFSGNLAFSFFAHGCKSTTAYTRHMNAFLSLVN
jgi:hypothetical protein